MRVFVVPHVWGVFAVGVMRFAAKPQRGDIPFAAKPCKGDIPQPGVQPLGLGCVLFFIIAL